jgi:hypothetical protein
MKILDYEPAQNTEGVAFESNKLVLFFFQI